MNTDMNQASPLNEKQLLVLLGKLQSLLTDAINSLDTKKLTPETRYLTICAITVNQAAGGYFVLRERRQIYASKFLIRPIIEATISAGAALKERGFLYRKTYSEILEQKKNFPKDPKTEAQFEFVLKELKDFFKKQDPNYPIENKEVNLRQASEWAEMVPLYEVAYRAYCRFTHGAIDAALGQLNEMTDNLDTQFVVGLVLMMLEKLQKHTYASIPDLESFRTQLGIQKQTKNCGLW